MESVTGREVRACVLRTKGLDSGPTSSPMASVDVVLFRATAKDEKKITLILGVRVGKLSQERAS
jgi:hypothetical protein